MELSLWQIIAGIIGTGGLSGLVASWVQRERVRIEARNATTARWKKLADEYQEQISALQSLVSSLQHDLTLTRAELARTQKALAAAEAKIVSLEAENERLENRLKYERRRRRELEKRFGEVNGD